MIRYDDIVQGTDEWLLARLGIATASEFKNIITSRGGVSKSLESYLKMKAWESTLKYPNTDSYVSAAMLHGIRTEDEAREYFKLCYPDLNVVKTGFITTDDGLLGCSPDFIIDDESGIGVGEIKCPGLEKHIEYLKKNELPAAYKIQVHGAMAVCEAEYAYFVSYHQNQKIKNFVYRVERDAFTNLLLERLIEFTRLLEKAKEEIGHDSDKTRS